jgi:hypothetical protein
METILLFFVGVFAQVVVISCSARLDRYIKPSKKWRAALLSESQKRFFILSNKTKRGEFLLLSVVMQLAAYLFVFVSLVLFILNLILQSDSMEMTTMIFSFTIAGIALAINLTEIIILSVYKNPDEVKELPKK